MTVSRPSGSHQRSRSGRGESFWTTKLTQINKSKARKWLPLTSVVSGLILWKPEVLAAHDYSNVITAVTLPSPSPVSLSVVHHMVMRYRSRQTRWPRSQQWSRNGSHCWMKPFCCVASCRCKPVGFLQFVWLCIAFRFHLLRYLLGWKHCRIRKNRESDLFCLAWKFVTANLNKRLKE